MPMALFAGLLLDLNNIPVWLRWLDFFSIIKYGYQLLVINQYNGQCFIHKLLPYFTQGHTCSPTPPHITIHTTQTGC